MKHYISLLLLLPLSLYAQNKSGATIQYSYQEYLVAGEVEELRNDRVFTFSFYYDKILISGDSLFNTPYDKFLIVLYKNKAYLVDDDSNEYVELSLLDYRKLITKPDNVGPEGNYSLNKERRKRKVEGEKCRLYEVLSSDSLVSVRQQLWVTTNFGAFHESLGYLNLLNSLFFPGLEGLILKRDLTVDTDRKSCRIITEATEISDNYELCKNYEVPYTYKLKTL